MISDYCDIHALISERVDHYLSRFSIPQERIDEVKRVLENAIDLTPDGITSRDAARIKALLAHDNQRKRWGELSKIYSDIDKAILDEWQAAPRDINPLDEQIYSALLRQRISEDDAKYVIDALECATWSPDEKTVEPLFKNFEMRYIRAGFTSVIYLGSEELDRKARESLAAAVEKLLHKTTALRSEYFHAIDFIYGTFLDMLRSLEDENITAILGNKKFRDYLQKYDENGKKLDRLYTLAHHLRDTAGKKVRFYYAGNYFLLEEIIRKELARGEKPVEILKTATGLIRVHYKEGPYTDYHSTPMSVATIFLTELQLIKICRRLVDRGRGDAYVGVLGLTASQLLALSPLEFDAAVLGECERQHQEWLQRSLPRSPWEEKALHEHHFPLASYALILANSWFTCSSLTREQHMDWAHFANQTKGYYPMYNKMLAIEKINRAFLRALEADSALPLIDMVTRADGDGSGYLTTLAGYLCKEREEANIKKVDTERFVRVLVKHDTPYWDAHIEELAAELMIATDRLFADRIGDETPRFFQDGDTWSQVFDSLVRNQDALFAPPHSEGYSAPRTDFNDNLHFKQQIARFYKLAQADLGEAVYEIGQNLGIDREEFIYNYLIEKIRRPI